MPKWIRKSIDAIMRIECMEVIVYEEDICNKQYIYLDWNVVKYIKNPRKKYLTLDTECRNIIEMSKRK